MKTKEWLDAEISDACTQLEDRWPELFLGFAGFYMVLSGLA